MRRIILVTTLAMMLSVAFFTKAHKAEGRASASNATSLLPGAVSIDDVSMNEGAAGTSNMVFTVTVTGSHTNTIGVNYSTANGEATAPSDYTSTSNQLQFAGTALPTTSQTISVPIIGDTDVELNETFVVNLEIVDFSASLADGQGVGTIINDDIAGFCSFSINKTNEHFGAIGTGYMPLHAAALVISAPPGCAWFSARSVPWIRLEGDLTRSGDSTLFYRVDANPSPIPRSGTIHIKEIGTADPYPDQVLTINQRGTLPPCVQEVSPAYQAFDGNLNNFTVNVVAPPDCRWEPIKEAPWISMEVESTFVRYGSGSIDYRLEENPGGQRSGVIDFGGKLHTITQGVDACPIEALCSFFPSLFDPSRCPHENQARSFRDGVLAKTTRGKRYTKLYYKFSTEAVGIMMLNPMLVLRSREVMQRYMPVVQGMVRGEQVTLTEGDIQEIDGFLRSFAEKGGPEFREALRGLREDLRNPQVHSEFKITVSEGAKRKLSGNSGLKAIKQASLMIGPLGLCLFVSLRMKLGRSRTRKANLKRLLWVAIPLAVVGVQWPVVSGQSPVGGIRWAVTSGASSPGSARNLLAPNIAGKYRTAKNDRTRQLGIEAVPAYSSYFGGNKNEEGNSIAVDSAGNIYVTGFTDSVNFPLVNASQPTFGGGQQDAFVAKLDPSGHHLLYSTYIGGNGQDNATSIAVDSGGNAYITGFTDSTNFPVSNAFQPTNRGNFNAFVVKLDQAGAILNSTLFGGSVGEYGSSIAVDSAGNVYFAGLATSSDIPTANALQSSLGGLVDIFVAKINPSGAGLIYSTYLGASGIEGASSIAVDSVGNLYVTGLTSSLNFTTLNPLQTTHGGGTFDAFVVKLNSSGTQIVYSTFLGGSGEDRSFRIAVDSAGSAYVTGDTDSTNFPVMNALQPIKGGSADAFIAKLNPVGNQLVYSTYLGGGGIEGGTAIAADSAGGAYVAGFTASINFPTMNPLQPNLAGAYDGFVAKLNSSGSALEYSTYLGGSSIDSIFGIALDSSASAYVMGVTNSTNFPTANAFQGANGGGTADVFIAKLAGQSPTAAPASISGQVTTSDGVPFAGVTVSLGGSQSAIRITNSAGRYSFLDLETGGFYTVTPERANYIFSPASQSFSLLSNKSDVAFAALAIAPTANPLDTSPEFFVRQQYLDFLNREPDQSGLTYWSAQIRRCSGDAQCISKKRIDVSNAFFYELEFQETGAYVYRMYKAAFGTLPGAPNRANLSYAQFMPDRSRVIGGPQLDASKTAFANAFVQRSVFTAQYPANMTAAQYVDGLNANTGNSLTQAQRDALVSELQNGTKTRATVLRMVADNAVFIDHEYNASFVLTQYFGYLRRDPDQRGYDFWLGQVNRFPIRNVAIQHAMVCSFITSREYQERFAAVVSHSNQECPQ